MTQFNLPGLVIDTRSDIDKEKDYVHEEVAPQAVPLKWNRGIEEWPKYSVRDQDGSSSCVGQAIAKALETITGVVESAHPIYRRRRNYPNLGMWLQDGGDIMRHLGTTTEAIDPSQKMSEQQMNADIFVQTPLTEMMYITADFKDIDTLATAIETQKHCIITINSDYQEWDNLKPVVLPQPTTFGHAICATYYFTDEYGKKCLGIDESWGLKQITQRVITEDFLIKRATGAMYFVPVIPVPSPPKPVFHFFNPLEYGQTNYGIKNLQDILKYESLFPANIVSSGFYGEITRKAVLAFQIKHNVDTLDILNALQGRRVGPKTILALNMIYS